MEPTLLWLLLIILQLPHGSATVPIARFEIKEDCVESAKASLEAWMELNPQDTTTVYQCQLDSQHSA